MKIDSYASLSSVIYFLIVYFDSPNIDLLYRNLPICLGFSSIFDFVLDTSPRQNANKICFCTRLIRIFAVENFRMGGQLFGVVRKIRHYVRCALSLYCK